MAWESAKSELARGFHATTPHDRIVLRRHPRAHTNKIKKTTTYVSMRIGNKLTKEMRWQDGDRIMVLLDYDKQVGLLKREAAGWKLRQSKQKHSAAQIQTTLNDKAAATIFPNCTNLYIPDTVSVSEEGILFALPTGPKGAVG